MGETDGEIQISNSGGTMSYVLQADGTLVGMDQVGDSMIFARPAADSAAGAWTLTAAKAEGIGINDTATLNVELDLVLYADGTGLLASDERKAACTWTQTARPLRLWRKAASRELSPCNRTAPSHG